MKERRRLLEGTNTRIREWSWGRWSRLCDEVFFVAAGLYAESTLDFNGIRLPYKSDYLCQQLTCTYTLTTLLYLKNQPKGFQALPNLPLLLSMFYTSACNGMVISSQLRNFSN